MRLQSTQPDNKNPKWITAMYARRIYLCNALIAILANNCDNVFSITQVIYNSYFTMNIVITEYVYQKYILCNALTAILYQITLIVTMCSYNTSNIYKLHFTMNIRMLYMVYRPF